MKIYNQSKHGIFMIVFILAVSIAQSQVELGDMELLGAPDFEDAEDSVAYGISADGTTIVGSSSMMGWRLRDGVWTLMGDLPGGNEGSEAFAVSADGSVVVGYTQVDEPDPQHWYETEEAFRWEDGVMVGLGDLPGGRYNSYATAVSADGSVVVGRSYVSDIDWEAFRWEDGTMVGLGFLPGHTGSEATDISADGSIIVGVSWRREPWVDRPVLWKDGNIMDLGLPEGDPEFSYISVEAVSDDGSIILCSGEFGPVFWKDGEWFELPGISGYEHLSPTDITADGSLIVGIGDLGSYNEIVIWDRDFAYQPIPFFVRNFMIFQGHLYISADGTTLVGAYEDRNPNDGHAFRIPVIKETSTWAGYPITNETKDVDTDGFMGWINVFHGDYIWSYDLNCWAYCPEAGVGDSGAWVYVYR